MRIILDTNVLVAAFRSSRGASHRLVRMIGPGAPFRLSLSVPLVLEYEMALTQRTGLSGDEAGAVVDYLCRTSDHEQINFLWRPFLKDPADEMVLEVAVVSDAECIVTHNVRDFLRVEKRFAIRVITPAAFLVEVEEPEK